MVTAALGGMAGRPHRDDATRCGHGAGIARKTDVINRFIVGSSARPGLVQFGFGQYVECLVNAEQGRSDFFPDALIVRVPVVQGIARHPAAT